MSATKRKADESADPPSYGEKKAKGSDAAAKEDVDSELGYFPIGKKRLTVSRYKNRVRIDIREYYEKDGKQLVRGPIAQVIYFTSRLLVL